MNENLAEAEKVLKGNHSLLHLARKTPTPILIIEGTNQVEIRHV